MTRTWPILALTLVAGGGGLALGLALDGDDAPPSPPTPASSADAPLPPGLQALTIEAPERYWLDGGFVPLEPPIRLPGPVDERTHTTVWLALPEGGTITTRWLEDQQRYTLSFPPGTVADRVATWDHRTKDGRTIPLVADVRGARVEADGTQTFRLFRPERPGPGQPLVGFEWTRGEATLGAEAHRRLAARMLDGGGFAWRTRPARRERSARVFRRRGACAACHDLDKPEIEREARVDTLYRAADADGFYVPLTVLRDEAPVELYRPRDMNADDPCVTVRCPDGPARLDTKDDGARRYRCDDGSIPRARWDIACAEARGDGHAERVCASRRAIYEHLDGTGREAFATAFEVCGITAARATTTATTAQE